MKSNFILFQKLIMEVPNEDNYSCNKSEKVDEIINTENLKKNKYIKTHTSFDENSINEGNYDISNFNYNCNIKKKINMNNEEEDEELDENDLSSDDEYEYKYKNIKIGILKLKLNIFNKIIISKIQKYYFYFISKINLKIKSTEIFLQGDNFLYSKLKLKTSDENKFYALKKIIYAIRKNTFDKLIKQNYLYHWKILKENKYLFNDNKNEASIKIKIVQFCSIIIKIFNKRYDKKYNLNYFVKKWKILLEEKEIYKNKIKKGMLILSNLFNRKIRKIFKKFPRNYLNLKQKTNIFKAINNNKQITYIIEDKEKFYQRGIQDFYNYKKKYINLLRQNKLIKLIEKLDTKNKINRNAFIFFHLLKNSTQINNYKKQIKNINNSLNDLKYDLMLNAAIIIKNILNEYIYEKLSIYKQNFLEKLYIQYKYSNIKTNYNCNGHINNDAQKEEINNLRKKYQRIFALQKIMIINNRNKFFYGDLNIQLKFSLLKKYFKIWKHYTFFFSINEHIKKIATQKIFLLLNNIYINHSRKNIFYIIRKKSLQKEFKVKKYYYFSLFIYILLKQHLLLHISKNAFSFIKYIWINQQNSNLKNKNYQCIKLYLIYKKFSNIKKYKYLTKWNFICSCIRKNKNLFQEKIKSILINIDKYNRNYILSKLFNKWNEKTQENEIEKQKKEIKIYFYLNKLITIKHLTILWLYFKKWSAISINLNNEYNYENLLIELEQIRKENDDLVAIYYKKRQEYAKTLYDYSYMKKYYCDSCINEKEDEIDYMSLKSNDIKEAGKSNDYLKISSNKVDINNDNSKYIKKTFGETSSKQKSCLPISFDENNFVVNEENRIQTDSNMSLEEEDELSNYVGKKISQLTQETINAKDVSDDDNNNIIIHDIKHENNYDKDSSINKNENINDYKNEYEEQKKYYENYINILLEKENELLEMKNILMNQKENISNFEEENK